MENLPYSGLTEFPPPPPGRNGWPWMEESLQLPGIVLDSSSWPRVSIVTPSYNQGQFLEETIRSILLQRYPNLEYFVMDGGSTDGSREIIQSYASYLTYWRSEKDNGQSAAISEGFRMSTGEILGWVNTDDLLLPNCLQKVGRYFVEHPEVDCVVGGAVAIDESGGIVPNPLGLPKIVRGERETFRKLLLRRGISFYQPASFWRRDAYLAAGGLDVSLRFAMDYDLYLRMACHKPFGHLNQLLACFRLHSQSKTTLLQSVRQRETAELRNRYGVGNDTLASTLYRGYLAVANLLHNLPIRIGFAIGLVNLPTVNCRGKNLW